MIAMTNTVGMTNGGRYSGTYELGYVPNIRPIAGALREIAHELDETIGCGVRETYY